MSPPDWVNPRKQSSSSNASQELQGENEKMQAGKENVMQEVSRKLQGIRQVQEVAMEVQRQSFQVELERVEKV